MGDSKEPAIEVCTRAAKLQMPEESEECLLNDVFGVVQRQPAIEYVAQNSPLKLIEKANDH